jgi:hypothetical protein
VITPALPVHLAGYGDRRGPATDVHDDLLTCVLVLDDEGARVALVTCDLLALSTDWSDAVRDAVAAVVAPPGSPRAAVVTSCTHVHAGPSTLTGTDAIGWPVPREYRAVLTDGVSSAAATAVASLAPVDARFARVPLPDGLAVNRRGHPMHPTVGLLTLEPVAVVANLAVHPTVTGPANRSVTTDWVGPFRRALEAATGRPAVFLQGCQGDVNPAVTAWDDGDPASWAPVVAGFAARVAAVARDAATAARPVRLGPPRARSRVVLAPVGETLLARLAGDHGTRPVEVVDWSVGDLRLVAVPGEGFHGVETAIRARVPDPLLVAGLAPAWHGYLPLPYTDGYEEGLSLGPEAVRHVVAALGG